MVGAGKLAMQEGVGRRNIEDWVQDGVRRVRSTSLGELKSSSSSETFSAARRLVLDSVLGRVSNSQAAVVRRKAVHQVRLLRKEYSQFFEFPVDYSWGPRALSCT